MAGEQGDDQLNPLLAGGVGHVDEVAEDGGIDGAGGRLGILPGEEDPDRIEPSTGGTAEMPPGQGRVVRPQPGHARAHDGQRLPLVVLQVPRDDRLTEQLADAVELLGLVALLRLAHHVGAERAELDTPGIALDVELGHARPPEQRARLRCHDTYSSRTAHGPHLGTGDGRL